MRTPTPGLALEIAARIGRGEPHEARRFPTGTMHYVYEVCFPSGPTVVVRIASEEGRHAMRDSVRLSRLLRPRGVPLPEIVVEQADGPVPFVVLERLPGVDLGPRLATLSREELLRIADRAVSRPQAERSLESLFRRFLADVERG